MAGESFPVHRVGHGRGADHLQRIEPRARPRVFREHDQRNADGERNLSDHPGRDQLLGIHIQHPGPDGYRARRARLAHLFNRRTFREFIGVLRGPNTLKGREKSLTWHLSRELMSL